MHVSMFVKEKIGRKTFCGMVNIYIYVSMWGVIYMCVCAVCVYEREKKVRVRFMHERKENRERERERER